MLSNFHELFCTTFNLARSIIFAVTWSRQNLWPRKRNGSFAFVSLSPPWFLDLMALAGWETKKYFAWDEFHMNFERLAKLPILYTLPETSMAPENGWLEYDFPFGTRMAYFQGLC